MMKRSLTLLSAALCMFSVCAQETPDPEIDLIRQAMPQNVPTPEAKHKVLVYSKPWGFPHASIKIGKKMMQVMSDETGLFEVTISDDLAQFEPDNLSQYDAVCLNNTTHLQKGFVKPALRNNLIEFVKKGGGLVAIHSATDGGWEEYTDMIGGNFDGHPWGANGTWSIANEDPTHPIVKDVYGGKTFLLKDELYQYKTFDRSKVRVLLSVDMASFQNLGRGEKRDDGDYALAWVRDFDQGRIFVSSLGHNKEIFYNPEILKMWVEGFRFVLGETDVDTSSIPKPETKNELTDGRRHEARVRTPEESLAEFEVKDDYYMEVVAADELLDQPVVCTWDGNGNMYVAEMATYMNDIAGSGTLENRSQVVRLEDTDGDGRM
ncbi:MAG: ThuA domain-containing protein, partial [Verrucomicrobiota bacterium]